MSRIALISGVPGMRAVDTNVLVRLIRRDNAAQKLLRRLKPLFAIAGCSASAESFVTRGDRASHIVLAETTRVLNSSQLVALTRSA